MVITSSQVQTSLAKQYLFKLCKHFARKIRVDFSECEGIAYFSFPEGELGQVAFHADEQQITFTVHALDEEAQDRLQAVVEEHLQLMRKAENPRLSWATPAA